MRFSAHTSCADGVTGLLVIAATFAALSPGSAHADDSAAAQGWDWRITPFLWAAGIDGDVSLGPASRPVDVAFSDIVNVLDGVVLLHFEGTHAGHGVFGDVTWLSLEPDDKGTATGGVTKSSFTTTIVEGGYLRGLSKDLSLELGVRYWDFGLEIMPARLPAAQRDDSWIDYFVGVRHEQPIGKNWGMTAEGNIGTGGSDTPWGVQLVFARKFDSGNAFVIGFKALGIDYLNQSVKGLAFNLDTRFEGVTVGYRFD